MGLEINGNNASGLMRCIIALSIELKRNGNTTALDIHQFNSFITIYSSLKPFLKENLASFLDIINASAPMYT